MAQQAAVKRAPEAVKPVNKGGRPVGSRNAPKVKVFDYSLYKQSFQKPADFYRYLEGYPNKEGLLISAFRLRPRIDHSLIGIDQSAILQTADPALVTEEAMGESYGRGAYMLKLNDANRVRGQQECCRTWLELWEVEKPPQYDPRTLCLGEAKNQDEITRLLNAGVLVRDTHGAPRLRGENDPSPVPLPAPNGNGHQNNELFGRDVVGQIVLAALNRSTQSPHDAVKDTIEVARMIQPQQPAVDLAALEERLFARLNGGAVPIDDDFRRYERMEAFLNKFRGPADAVATVAAAASDAGSNPAAWVPHIPGILAQVRAMIPEITGALQSFRVTGPSGQTMLEGHKVQQQRKPMTMEQRIEVIARDGFQRMNEGLSGFDYAAYVCGFVDGGLEVYKFLEPTGVAGLVALVAMNPATRGMATDPTLRAQLENFLASFFSFDPEGGPEDPPEDGAGAGAAAAA